MCSFSNSKKQRFFHLRILKCRKYQKIINVFFIICFMRYKKSFHTYSKMKKKHILKAFIFWINSFSEKYLFKLIFPTFQNFLWNIFLNLFLLLFKTKLYFHLHNIFPWFYQRKGREHYSHISWRFSAQISTNHFRFFCIYTFCAEKLGCDIFDK